MKQIKVAHISTVSSSLKGLMLNQLQNLQQVGYEIFCISSPGPEVPALEAAGIRHTSVEIAREIAPLADLRALWQLYRVLYHEKPIIVHTHLAKSSLLGQLAARMAGVPIVLNTIHGYHFHEHMSPGKRNFFIQLEKIGARCSDLILSQNKEDIQTTIDEKICLPAKIKYLGNGIDLTQFDPTRFTADTVQTKRAELNIPAETLVVGFVGRLAAKRKGFLDFLRAGQQIVEQLPDVRFLIVGETDYGKADAIQPEIARKYGLQDHCLFLGFRPNDELPLLYKLMDVLVLPSPFEGIPRAVMEASAMGIPSVVTNVRGNREAVTHDQNGLLVPLGDVPALAQAIIEVITNREKNQRMSGVARRIATECFDEQRVFDLVKTTYTQLLRQKGLLELNKVNEANATVSGW